MTVLLYELSEMSFKKEEENEKYQIVFNMNTKQILFADILFL